MFSYTQSEEVIIVHKKVIFNSKHRVFTKQVSVKKKKKPKNQKKTH